MGKFNKILSEYGQYLDEIWRRLYNLVIVFVILFVIGFSFSGVILKFIISAFNLQNATIIATSPFQFFDLAITVGMYASFVLCVPLFLFHLYMFLKDGLKNKEKNFFIFLLPIGLILFCLGFAYGVVVLYFTLNSIAVINIGLGIKNFWDISIFLSQIILTSILLGLVFQFPIILTFFTKNKILDTSFLRNKRRHAIVIMFIVTSLLPPTDGFSLLVMVLPLIVLYEITILINSVYFLNRSYIIKTT
jgi:sec-independent protein translocase protein TatC